jgi:hypothetical protein
MFRAAATWALLLLGIDGGPCAAQGIGARAVVQATPTYSAQTLAFLNAAMAAGSAAPSTTDVRVIDALVRCEHNLATGDPWDNTTGLWLTAEFSQQASYLNAVNPWGAAAQGTNCTGGGSPDGGPTWTKYKGVNSNGHVCVADGSGNNMSYLDTGVQTSGLFTQNAAHMAAIFATGTVASGTVAVGIDTSNIFPMKLNTIDYGGRPNSTSTTGGGSNAVWSKNQSPTPAAGPGYYAWTRTSSAGGDATDPAGTLMSSTALGGWTGTSAAIHSTYNFWILGENVNNTCCGGFSPIPASQIVSMAKFGGAMTTQQEATEYTCFKAWMVARGLP